MIWNIVLTLYFVVLVVARIANVGNNCLCVCVCGYIQTTSSCMAAYQDSIRSSNVIESMFATIRRRNKQINGNGSREVALAMMFMIAKQAEKT